MKRKIPREEAVSELKKLRDLIYGVMPKERIISRLTEMKALLEGVREGSLKNFMKFCRSMYDGPEFGEGFYQGNGFLEYLNLHDHIIIKRSMVDCGRVIQPHNIWLGVKDVPRDVITVECQYINQSMNSLTFPKLENSYVYVPYPVINLDSNNCKYVFVHAINDMIDDLQSMIDGNKEIEFIFL